MNHLDLDHLGKECFETAMRRNPKRWMNGWAGGVASRMWLGERGRFEVRVPLGLSSQV